MLVLWKSVCVLTVAFVFLRHFLPSLVQVSLCDLDVHSTWFLEILVKVGLDETGRFFG